MLRVLHTIPVWTTYFQQLMRSEAATTDKDEYYWLLLFPGNYCSVVVGK